MVSKHPSRSMTRSHGHKNDDKDYKENNMKDSGQKFDPWDQPEGVHIHQAFDYQHGKNDKCKMPPLRLIVREIDSHQALNHSGRGVGHASKE